MDPKDMTLEQIRAELKAIREGRSVFGDGGMRREIDLEIEIRTRPYDTRK